MDSNTAYDNFRKEVKGCAAKLPRPLEISQSALWLKSIGVEAFQNKRDDLYTFSAGDKFGFSEGLVNQLVEYAMRYKRDGMADEQPIVDAYKRGYEDARREFAKATGLYTEDDLDD